jgi:hypothetical protein
LKSMFFKNFILPMRKHLTLKSLTSVPSDRKSVAADTKPFPKKKSERHDVSPREFVIRNILNYSLALSVFQTQEAGFVKMVMN